MKKVAKITAIVIFGFVALLIVLGLAGFLYQKIATSIDKRKFPPPGEMVDVGGRKMHLHCTGAGTPTVVLEPGGLAFSINWSKVQPEVAGFTRVCSYDRAGYGWSDAGEEPRTGERIATELHALLTKAGIAGPYVLAGNSFGGYIVRMFESRYPGEVAGMVLVEASHEDRHSPMPENCWQKQLKDVQSARNLAKVGFLRLLMKLAPPKDMTIYLAKFPEEVRPLVKAEWSRSVSIATVANELKNYEKSASQVRAAPSELDQKPLAVLVADDYEYPGWCPVDTEQKRDLLRAWKEKQRELAALSSSGTLTVVGNSGHFVQLDQPREVIKAIRQVVNEVRQPNESAEEDG